MKKWLLPLLATTLFAVGCEDKSTVQNLQQSNKDSEVKNLKNNELTQVTVIAP